MPEDAAWADPVIVPDDIRELQVDIDDYHRELRASRRRQRWHWLTGTRAWQRWSFPAGVLTGAFALAMVVFALLAVDGRSARPDSGPVPLAAPTVAVGTKGGLLPDVPLTTTTGASVSARSLRPALVVLLPPHCDCKGVLTSLAGQAEEVQLRLVVVGSSQPDAEVAALPGQLHYADLVAAYDAAGNLSSTYAASGVTAVILGRDGVVDYIQPQVNERTRLEGPLQSAFLLPPAIGG
jgi:hypothetical protein